MTGGPPDPLLLARAQKLLLLDFTADEMVAPLEQALKRAVSLTEVEHALVFLRESWGASAQELDGARHLLWHRSEMFRRDLLGVYQDELSNYQATAEGKFSHDDGRPVLKNKWSDVAGVAKMILDIERAALEDRRKALAQGAGSAPPAAPPPAQEDPEEVFDEEIDIPTTELV